MRILGISAFYHDSAAALLVDGRPVAAPRKSASRARSTIRAFPSTRSAIASRKAGIGLDDLDHVVFFEKPLLKFERLLETYLANAPRGYQLVPHGDAGVAQGEAVPEGRHRRRR